MQTFNIQYIYITDISHYIPASHLFIELSLFIHKVSLKHTRLYRYEIFINSRKIFACSYYFNNAVGMFNHFYKKPNISKVNKVELFCIHGLSL